MEKAASLRFSHGSIPFSVEDAGDEIVAGDQDQLAYGSDDVGGSAVAIAASPERQAQLAVHPSDPVNE